MDVRDTAEAIRSMEIRGAGRIARAASLALSEYVSGYTGSDRDAFLADIGRQREILLSSRPTAVSLYNGISITLRGIGGCGTVEDIKEKVRRNSDEFIESSRSSLSTIAKLGADLITDGDVVLTHCNSSAAVGAIIEAHRSGKRFKVFSTESRPWGQGFITVSELEKAGVDVTLIIDSVVTTVMDTVTKVLVGADTVTVEGDLYNKVGTAQISLIAASKHRPFYVCAEWYKVAPVYKGGKVVIEERGKEEVLGNHTIPNGVKVFNPVFDRTEAKNITMFVTDQGLIRPEDIRALSISRFGEKEERI